MSSNHSSLSNPRPGEKIPAGTLMYFRMRNRQRQWEAIVDEFERSGINQAELCRRTGRDPSKISALLASPSNIESDTASDILFGISGAQPTHAITHPLAESRQDDGRPEWLEPPKVTGSAENTHRFEETGNVIVLRSKAA